MDVEVSMMSSRSTRLNVDMRLLFEIVVGYRLRFVLLRL